MDKYLKYFLWFLIALLIISILYLIIKIIIFYFKAKNALKNTLSNSKYCQKEICDPTQTQLVQKLPTDIITDKWQIDVAKYCSIIIYSIIEGVRKNIQPNYPNELFKVKELYDDNNNPIFGAIFTDKSENIWIKIISIKIISIKFIRINNFNIIQYIVILHKRCIQ